MSASQKISRSEWEALALSFIRHVRERVRGLPGVYEKFRETLKNRSGRSSECVVQDLHVILSGHIDLLLELNAFAPVECRLRREDLEIIP